MNLTPEFTAHSSQYRLYVSQNEIKAEKKGIRSWIRSHITNRAAYKLEAIAGVLKIQSDSGQLKYDSNTLTAIKQNLEAKIRKPQLGTKEGSSAQSKRLPPDSEILGQVSIVIQKAKQILQKKESAEKELKRSVLVSEEALVIQKAKQILQKKESAEKELKRSVVVSEEAFIGPAEVGTKILMHKASVTAASFTNLGELDAKDDFSHLTQFCKEILKIENPKFEKVNPGLTSGASGAVVVLVKDSTTGELKSVLKMYTQEEAILRDASAMKLMAQFKGEEYTFTQPMGLASFTSSGSTTYCLAQTPARGKPLDSLFTVAKSDDHLPELEAALVKTAKNLGELHTKTKILDPGSRSDHAKEKKEFKSYADRFSGVTTDSKKVELDFFEKKLAEVDFSKSTSTILHGDFQPGNIFYDTETQTFTWIDLDMCSDSIDSNKPVGLASYDVAYFSQWMAIRGLQNGIKLEKVSEMRKEFEEQYIQSRKMNKDEEVQFRKELACMKAMLPIKYYPDLVEGGRFYQGLGKDMAEGLRQILDLELELQMSEASA